MSGSDAAPDGPETSGATPPATVPAAVAANGWADAEGADELAPGEILNINVEGFEGPLDLLLALARTQKVDLTKISILALVEQYLGFIAEVQKVRLELAADYLVMAAWLAFLKSRLLLPREEKTVDGGPSADARTLGDRRRTLPAPPGYQRRASVWSPSLVRSTWYKSGRRSRKSPHAARRWRLVTTSITAVTTVTLSLLSEILLLLLQL